MAKRAKVPLHVLVVEGTRKAVKELADVLECSQGEVVDRAIVLLGANENGVSFEQPVPTPLPAPKGLEPLDEPGSADGRQRCRHCGTENALPADAKPLRPCPSCFRGDHRPFEPCPACLKEQHQKEMAKKHGTEHVDYNTDWGA